MTELKSKESTTEGGDPLAHLHKMSTTAGLGTTDYVAVNGMSIVALRARGSGASSTAGTAAPDAVATAASRRSMGVGRHHNPSARRYASLSTVTQRQANP